MPLPEKEDFFSHLNMEDISDADYKHKTSPWELMDPQTKNDSDKTQGICIPFDPF